MFVFHCEKAWNVFYFWKCHILLRSDLDPNKNQEAKKVLLVGIIRKVNATKVPNADILMITKRAYVLEEGRKKKKKHTHTQ